MLKYYNKMVVLQEVPGEISVSFAIAGCPHNCKNCSWANTINKLPQKELTDEKYISQLEKYKNYATCILFMGGNWEKEDLIHKLKLAKKYGFKTCLYTGDVLEHVDNNILENLSYVKVGPYIENLGGLDKPTTNQRFIDLVNKKVLNNEFQRVI